MLQDKVIHRLGGTQAIKVDVRIIAATNCNLEQAVEDRVFREDLFYRLNVFPIVVPPLRDRIEDIPGLVWEFIEEFSAAFGKKIELVPEESMRELQRLLVAGQRATAAQRHRARGRSSRPDRSSSCRSRSVSRASRMMPAAPQTLKHFELEHIRATLESTRWRVRGQGGAAELLGLKPTTLESRMAKLGLSRPGQRA